MPRKKASVRWCSSGNDRRRLRHFAFSLPLLSFSLSNLRALRFLFVFSFPAFVSFACFVRALLPAFVLSSSFFLSRAPLPFAFSYPASHFPSPYLRHLLPAFSVFAPIFSASTPIFSASTPIFVVAFRLFIARKTHSANPADAHELNSLILPHFLHDPHGRKRR